MFGLQRFTGKTTSLALLEATGPGYNRARKSQGHLFPKAMITRSIENGVFTATANRIGTERGVTFSGMSQITGPKGELLKQLSNEKAGLTWPDIKPADARNKMITERNHILNDRRPDTYSRLVQRLDD